MTTSQFELQRNRFGKLELRLAGGELHEDVHPVRAFPIQTPQHNISLVTPDGREVAWISSLAELSAANRDLLLEELEGREFMPVISRIEQVSSFALPSTWQVVTDRGNTEFVLKGDEDIRRIGASSLLISDNHGIQYLIRDMFEIDKHSRKILDRFL